MPLNILAIESSCDETSVAVSSDGRIVSNIIASQKVHEQYGGVVPELASRAHMQNIVPVVSKALDQSGLSLDSLNAIAFTQSPGLIGALLVGAGFAKSMALSLQLPLIAVHHMHAHVLANCIGETTPSYPFLCLTVSGGHTQIVQCDSPLTLTVLGETRDDAAGEAYDKSAKLLGLPYPGGPLIDQYASSGNPHRYIFPEPQIDGYDFSFSGVKTAILYFLRENLQSDAGFVEKNLPDICASIQHRINTILVNKFRKAALATGIRELCMAGGVSANTGLRKLFREMGDSLHANIFIPPFEYCTDNAAMIAITAHYKYLAGEFADLSISPEARAVWD
jgi:N6-L-threonylcarbamoyladenine synthase